MSSQTDVAVARELWASFISLIRSYTAAHGLNGTRQAVLEVSEASPPCPRRRSTADSSF